MQFRIEWLTGGLQAGNAGDCSQSIFSRRTFVPKGFSSEFDQGQRMATLRVEDKGGGKPRVGSIGKDDAAAGTAIHQATPRARPFCIAGAFFSSASPQHRLLAGSDQTRRWQYQDLDSGSVSPHFCHDWIQGQPFTSAVLPSTFVFLEIYARDTVQPPCIANAWIDNGSPVVGGVDSHRTR